MRLVVLNHVSLDGVMQAPGRPDEDTRGGFVHGGWAVPNSDEVMANLAGPGRTPGGALLLGRRSYEGMLSAWNQRGGPFKDALNDAPKFVASHSGSTKLAWPNSTLLHGDVPEAVRELKQRPGGDLLIMGSGALIRSLLPHHLIDEFVLFIHPLLLGSGLRMFSDDGMTQLKLVDNVTTPKGVIFAKYQLGETDRQPSQSLASRRVESS
ncbi:MAG TPA: dihydrofolate reductase family protein [Candidatus Dormibacteraeota bacterium]|nr:dihydrofolate reductase family protein [Candidatus Dormibacteraeota bacterium]